MATELGAAIREHVCFYASYDRTIDADRSRGDPAATYQAALVRRDPAAGRHGGALVFSARDNGWAEDELTYAAAGNVPYRTGAWSATVALWLQCDPDADLAPTYPVDPFHVSRHPADGAIYLDLTRPNDDRYGSPRKLRLGLYGDSPARDRFVGGQLIVVGDLGWRAGAWHHVVATWRNVNTGREDGAAALYVDGALRGWMEGYRHQVTWEVGALRIGLGQRYAGLLDELLILDRELAAEEVRALYELAGPLGGVL
jgi:concanavalin A-like lectin/glucanase superfamily protein